MNLLCFYAKIVIRIKKNKSRNLKDLKINLKSRHSALAFKRMDNRKLN